MLVAAEVPGTRQVPVQCQFSPEQGTKARCLDWPCGDLVTHGGVHFKVLIEDLHFIYIVLFYTVFVLSRSRLGCQVCLSKALDGLVAKVPESVADARQSQDETGNT